MFVLIVIIILKLMLLLWLLLKNKRGMQGRILKLSRLAFPSSKPSLTICDDIMAMRFVLYIDITPVNFEIIISDTSNTQIDKQQKRSNTQIDLVPVNFARSRTALGLINRSQLMSCEIATKRMFLFPGLLQGRRKD